MDGKHPTTQAADVVVCRAEREDCFTYAKLIREQDAQAIEAFAQKPLLTALLDSVDLSDRAYTLAIDGEPTALCGIHRLCNDSPVIGQVWSVVGPTFFDRPRIVARQSREILERLSFGYTIIGNVVDARNHRLARWLLWLGFDLVRTHPPIDGIPFHEYAKVV